MSDNDTNTTEKKQWVVIDLRASQYKDNPDIVGKLYDALHHIPAKMVDGEEKARYFKKTGTNREGEKFTVFGQYVMDAKDLIEAPVELKDALITQWNGKEEVEIDVNLRNTIGSAYDAIKGNKAFERIEAYKAEHPKEEKEKVEKKPKENEPAVFFRFNYKLVDAFRASKAHYLPANKTYAIAISQLPKAHPDLKNVAAFDDLKEMFKKDGAQVSDEIKATIGTAYDAEIGQKNIEEALARKAEREQYSNNMLMADAPNLEKDSVLIGASKRDPLASKLGSYNDDYGVFEVKKADIAKLAETDLKNLAMKSWFADYDEYDSGKLMSNKAKEQILNTAKAKTVSDEQQLDEVQTKKKSKTR